MSADDTVNPDWEVLEGFEPWEPEEDEPLHEGGCDYCGAPDVRDGPEPFGGKPCCDTCFALIIGDESDLTPWRCGNAIDQEPTP